MCARGVSAEEIPVLQVVLPPLLWGLRLESGEKDSRCRRSLEREWMGGYHIVRLGDLALLKP